jgi:hypothetical protein
MLLCAILLVILLLPTEIRGLLYTLEKRKAPAHAFPFLLPILPIGALFVFEIGVLLFEYRLTWLARVLSPTKRPKLMAEIKRELDRLNADMAGDMAGERL